MLRIATVDGGVAGLAGGHVGLTQRPERIGKIAIARLALMVVEARARFSQWHGSLALLTQ